MSWLKMAGFKLAGGSRSFFYNKWRHHNVLALLFFRDVWWLKPAWLWIYPVWKPSPSLNRIIPLFQHSKAQHSGNKEPFFTPQHTEFGQVWWISEKQKDLKGLSSRGSQLLPVSIISRKVLLNICISLILDSISVIMLFFTEQLVQNTLMSTIGSTK